MYACCRCWKSAAAAASGAVQGDPQQPAVRTVQSAGGALGWASAMVGRSRSAAAGGRRSGNRDAGEPALHAGAPAARRSASARDPLRELSGRATRRASSGAAAAGEHAAARDAACEAPPLRRLLDRAAGPRQRRARRPRRVRAALRDARRRHRRAHLRSRSTCEDDEAARAMTYPRQCTVARLSCL